MTETLDIRAAAHGAQDIATLVAHSHTANAALMRGDAERYVALMRLAEDFVLMSPFGGTPSHGADYTPEKIAAMGRFFRNGSLAQEPVGAWATPDMVTLAVIERANVEVGALPAQDWALRVTLVFRRDGDGWQLVHRHADPLAVGVSHEEAAALARR
jgi:ketosteroid isomerase-like protein